MSTESNKSVVLRFTEEVWKSRRYESIDELFAADYQDPEIPGDPREGLKRFFRGYFAARPDFEVIGEELTAEDDRVVQYISGRFTNTEEKRGPVGKEMRMDEINIFRVRDGQIRGRFGIGRSH